MLRFKHKAILFITLYFSVGLITALFAADDYTQLRHILVEAIEADVKATSLYLDKSVLDPRVLNAMRKVPRHEFVPPSYRRFSYNNRPLPIGYGQTISQPYMVAVMTDLLKLKPNDKVLEIGTGSGYQAAMLAELIKQVFTIEIIKPLALEAKSRLIRLGYDNIETRIGDGYYGWKEHAPFDAIVVTAAGSHVPPALIRQLKPGGRMVIPVGSPFMVQQLLLVEKTADKKIKTSQIMPVAFVPLTGKH
jgi:protein-L-isoaspartate(D-aspartate) O-methyltransferase